MCAVQHRVMFLHVLENVNWVLVPWSCRKLLPHLEIPLNHHDSSWALTDTGRKSDKNVCTTGQ